MKYIQTLLILILCTVPSTALARLTITEIMYDPEGTDTNREWIEVYNSGDDVVILGGSGNTWRLYEESTNGTLNRRTFNFEDGASSITLPNNSYAVVVRNAPSFRQDYPDFDGLLFASAISLTNSEGRVLTFRDAHGVEMSSPLLYTPIPEASGTGASLQLQDEGEWIAGLPTPGAVNTTEPFVLDDDTVDEGDVDDEFLNLESSWPFTGEELYLDAGENRRVFVGEEVDFNGRIRFKSGDQLQRSSATWAFGDGERGVGSRPTHTYSNPGVYRVVMRTYYEGKLYQDSFLVHVVETEEVALGKVAFDSVELINTSAYEVELSNWTLASEGKSKRLAEGTFVLPRSSIFVPFASDGGLITLHDSAGRSVQGTRRTPESVSNDDVYQGMLQRLEEMLDSVRKKQK